MLKIVVTDGNSWILNFEGHSMFYGCPLYENNRAENQPLWTLPCLLLWKNLPLSYEMSQGYAFETNPDIFLSAWAFQTRLKLVKWTPSLFGNDPSMNFLKSTSIKKTTIRALFLGGSAILEIVFLTLSLFLYSQLYIA